MRRSSCRGRRRFPGTLAALLLACAALATCGGGSSPACPDVAFDAKADTSKTCFPACRPGYLCNTATGACVDQCNPPCQGGLVCVDGDCVIPSVDQGQGEDIGAQIELPDNGLQPEDTAQGDVEPPSDDESGLADSPPEGEMALDNESDSWDDTSPEEDLPDIPVQPDILIPANCPGEPSCISPAPAQPDVPVKTVKATPPALEGGPVVLGYRTLTAVELFIGGTFTGMVTSVDMASGGNTRGSIEFADTDFGMSVNIDLYMYFSTVYLGDLKLLKSFAFKAAGCHTFNGNLVETDLSKCKLDWPDGTAAPASFAYQATGDTLKVLVVLDANSIKNLFPPEYASYKDMIVSGGMALLLTFGPAVASMTSIGPNS